ncbi:flagellar biosynthesis regulator FlhF [Halobacillus massiliensis]|uniref:flagellar biosynthesis regulator FlhF n=1 Tax=Halobacillus massiliensis TaxID=1926286 RepID=UPI0009E20789
MEIKKFKGPSMHEVMKEVKKELGQDAVILNSKEVKPGGFFGIFKKRIIEVIAVCGPEYSKGE